MARCQVKVLGGFEVWVDGGAVPPDAWRTRRAADVVKLLAIEPGHAMHRERVMDLLWPDLDGDAASRNLRKAIHHARRAMGTPEAISSQGGMLSLLGGDVEVDTDRFLELAEAAGTSGAPEAHAAAARSVTGEVLPGDRYEPWASEARDRIGARLIAALRGARMWERLLEIDPTDEESHRELMRQHADGGRRAEAIRQFERLRLALREHVGIGPDRETIALYERVLALGGGEPPTSAQRAAQLVAMGLVALNVGDPVEAERLAREAREIALAAQLGEELGDASTLLALTSVRSGRWDQAFLTDFSDSLMRSPELVRDVFDAQLCFVEYFITGVEGALARDYAHRLLDEAAAARSLPGQAVGHLMLGEALLLLGELDEATMELRRACELNRSAGTECGRVLSLEHLAELNIVSGRPREAARLLNEAFEAARRSSAPSHLVVRIHGVQVRAASDLRRGLEAVRIGERFLADARRVCQPCSISFHVHATMVCARAGDTNRAHHHLLTAERVSGLWQGGPWSAAVWEARASVRRAEGDPEQARALLREAEDGFSVSGRPLDASRCRDAARQISDQPVALAVR